MKSFLTIAFLFVSFVLLGQTRTVSGRLTSSGDNQPLPGVNILIKGTTTGTVTDADGYYSIEVPIGSTLIFRFLGMVTQEYVVTEKDLISADSKLAKKALRRTEKKQKDPEFTRTPILVNDDSDREQPGVAKFSEDSPTLRGDIPDIRNIKSLKRTGNRFKIKSYIDPYRYSNTGITFTSVIGLEQATQLPELQNVYAQGRPLNGGLEWRGPETGEIFSWGPALQSLEFNGANYPYDLNGQLVPFGTGNGQAALPYNPVNFYRNGFFTKNGLLLVTPGPGSSLLQSNIGHRQSTGILPGTRKEQWNARAVLKDLHFSRTLNLKVSSYYQHSTADIPSKGANRAAILGAVYRTPITFDNANGLDPAQARKSSSAYTLADNSVRSHAPGLIDNPYGLINTLPDHEEVSRFTTGIDADYHPDSGFSLHVSSDLNLQTHQSIFGNAPGYAASGTGRLTSRSEHQAVISTVISPSYNRYGYLFQYKIQLSYLGNYESRKLNRIDASGFENLTAFGHLEQAAELNSLNQRLNRNSHELILRGNLEYNSWLRVNLSSKHYFSNTVNYSDFSNFLPSVGITFDLSDLLYLWPVQLEVYSSFSKSVREAALIYDSWSYGSTNQSISQYQTFTETGEIFYNSALSPELESKFEAGIEFSYDWLSMDFSYFRNNTRDLLTPSASQNGFVLQNVGDVLNQGIDLSLSQNTIFPEGHWKNQLNWHSYTSEVRSLSDQVTVIPLSGFSEVQSVIAENEPLGAIYGSSYQRHPNGEIVIGNDGFPLKNTNLTKIGNPIPDWTLSWHSSVSWKKFSASLVAEFKKGGDLYNGTRAILDYLGRSKETGDLRNTTNYIFHGRTLNGAVNTIPVSFSDASADLSANRWVRYGWDGIGETYIEDASWFRLTEIKLSYAFHFPKSGIDELKLSLISRNLFILSPYSGTAISSGLFGYQFGQGLDLFNEPSPRSYAVQVIIKL